MELVEILKKIKEGQISPEEGERLIIEMELSDSKGAGSNENEICAGPVYAGAAKRDSAGAGASGTGAGTGTSGTGEGWPDTGGSDAGDAYGSSNSNDANDGSSARFYDAQSKYGTNDEASTVNENQYNADSWSASNNDGTFWGTDMDAHNDRRFDGRKNNRRRIFGSIPGIPDGVTIQQNVLGGIEGDIDGVLYGNVMGHVNGDIDGIVHGNIMGPVNGSVAGAVLGNIMGSVDGPIDGKITGNITGPCSGDINGEVRGNITGSVHGDVLGGIYGNVTGSVEGDIAGTIKGNIIGGIVGDIAGSIFGNILGSINGDILGKVKGNIGAKEFPNTSHIDGDISGEVEGNIYAIINGDVSGEIGSKNWEPGKGCYVHEIRGDIMEGALIHGDVGTLYGECYGTVEGEIYHIKE